MLKFSKVVNKLRNYVSVSVWIFNFLYPVKAHVSRPERPELREKNNKFLFFPQTINSNYSSQKKEVKESYVAKNEKFNVLSYNRRVMMLYGGESFSIFSTFAGTEI